MSRTAIMPPNGSGDWSSTTRPDLPKQFRERNGLILPYYEIELPLKVIRHFVIGPCTNQALSRSALESMLYHKAREFRKNERKVLLSEVPYVLR